MNRLKKILVVDDSALMRRVIFDIINKDRNLHVEKYATNGLDALDLLVSGEEFDAIVLDINMPKMNGIEFLRELKKRGMNEKVLIVSTLAKEGAKETIQALELGAFDFVTKPDSLAIAKGNLFSNMLLDMLYAAVNLSRRTLDNEVKQQAKDHSSIRKTHNIYGKALQGDTSKHSKKPLCGTARKLVALACSTGGPKALQYVVPFLPANLDAAVLIVQHMPEGFTASLSNRLDELSRIKVKEAAHGDILEKGTVYLAKGGSQMRLIEKGRMQHILSVTAEEARNGLRPCADIMYESLVGSSFDEITCVVMTGMGADGTKGIIQLEQKNKIYVIAQDEESSTVYGMPKAIADAKAVDEVVTLRKIADAITKHVGVR
ncbi:chemotaxis-specific protein-glutamate methyltransferase CheB [Jutongia hominis]|uniref:chemotaxis-specific protein-glutamate methyltransferase CheB n=1 Tax=Jutongia hominis TaxID=2763664 RepID=UPI0038CC1DE1